MSDLPVLRRRLATIASTRLAGRRGAWRDGVRFGVFLASSIQLVPFYLTAPFQHLWIDARLYFAATAAWLNGASPWSTSVDGVPFAAPPPALLLGLPFQPLGETLGIAAWMALEVVAVCWLLRRLRLPAYWLLFGPIAEALLGGSADLWLAAACLAGGGWIAAVTKPYSIPALIADRRGRAVGAAALIAVATVPVMPWDQFLASSAVVEYAFAAYTLVVSAYGAPALMAAVALALLTLNSRESLSLITPGLLAQQPHYLMFSLETISSSTILSIGASLPAPGAMAFAVVAYAIARRARSRVRPDLHLVADTSDTTHSNVTTTLVSST